MRNIATRLTTSPTPNGHSIHQEANGADETGHEDPCLQDDQEQKIEERQIYTGSFLWGVSTGPQRWLLSRS